MSQLITQASGFHVDDAVKIHRERARTQDYVALGRVVMINLAVDVGDRELTPQDRLLLGKIDYMNEGPMIARSKDYQDVLLPMGAKPFPDVPDPLWVPPNRSDLIGDLPELEIDISAYRGKPPMLAQRMDDRAAGVMESPEGDWVIFQPVLEVWFRRFDIADYGVVKFHKFLDTHTALMINAGNCDAYFVGGRPEFLRCR